MNKSIPQNLVIIFAYALNLVVWSNASAQTGHALLIGVNEYQTEEFANLRGAVNDVLTMQEILISRYGFLPANIVTLTDKAATRQSILAAFDNLVEQTADVDYVYVHFSGHGSQVKDLNGDEDDGTDETILPYDGRTKDIPDITDDEIGDFLRRLPTTNAIIVLDSCHSGTATRGGILTRSVPVDDRLALYKNTINNVSTRAIVPIDVPDQYILFSGAAANQSALDGPIDGKYRGFFSYALAEALKSAEQGASPRTIHKRVGQTYQRLSQSFGGLQLPDPQFEASTGMLEKSLFPEARSAPPARAYLTAILEKGSRGRLLRGSSMDAQPGSLWAIFSSSETGFDLSAALATAIVVSIDGGDSIINIEGNTLKRDIAYRAIALPTAVDSASVPVRLDIADDSLASELKSHLAEHVTGVQFVGSNDFARFVVATVNNHLRVFDASGLVAIEEIPLAPLAAATGKLAETLNRSKSAVSLSQMINPASKLVINASIVGADSTNNMRIKHPDDPRSHQNSIMLEITVSADSYLTIIDIDPQGNVSILFPNAYTKTGFLREGFVSADAPVRIPDSLAAGNRAGFFWDYSPPAGLDTIQVFATTDLATAMKIRTWIASLDTVTTRGATRSADYSRSLIDLQKDLASDVRTRAIRVVQDEATAGQQSAPASATVNLTNQPDWNSVSLSVRISE